MIIGCTCAYQDATLIGEALESLLAMGCERLIVVDGAWRWFEWYGDTPASSDGTQEIALSYGAEVIQPPPDGWPDEVAARNAYLVGQPGDWYMYLDADERARGELTAPLDAAEGAYLLWHKTPSEGDWRRMRLVQENGTLRYQNAHWAIYRDGRLVEKAALLDSLWIDHVGRPGDTDRARRKTAWYARASAKERAYLVDGRPPAMAVEERDMERIAYRYVGGGAWIPGVPARDLLEFEAMAHADVLTAHLAGKRPIYEKVEEISTEVEAEAVPEVEAEQPTRRRRNEEKR